MNQLSTQVIEEFKLDENIIEVQSFLFWEFEDK